VAIELKTRFVTSVNVYGAMIIEPVSGCNEDLPVSVIPPEDMDPEESLTNRARGDLEKPANHIGQQDETLEVVVSTHSARREIVKYAEGHGIDLIVVGSYGKDGIKGMTGSTANSVVRTATIDVLVVHPTE
jgi:universal stress protein A